jgi:aubergine-like protein
MPGFSTSVILTEAGLFLRVGLKNKFINGKTCLEKIQALQSSSKNGDFQREAEDFFNGYSVMANYGNHKVYKLKGVSFDKTPCTTTILMKEKDGSLQEITLIQYYKDQYQKSIKNVDQPLLVASTTNSKGEESSIYLIPELCLLTGMDEDMKNQDNLKKSMVSGTRLTPKQKMEKIEEIKQLLYKTNSKKRQRTNRATQQTYTLPDPNDIREKWGLNVEKFMEFKGRILEPPRIVFKDGGKIIFNN